MGVIIPTIVNESRCPINTYGREIKHNSHVELRPVTSFEAQGIVITSPDDLGASVNEESITRFHSHVLSSLVCQVHGSSIDVSVGI